MALRASSGGHAGVLAAVQHLGLIGGGLAAGKQLVGGGLVGGAGHVAVVGEHPHDGQVVALAHLVVVGVVGGGDLHHAGALLHVGVLVADDGDLLVEQGQDHMAAVEMSIPGVGPVDGHGGIAQHGLGAGGGQFQGLAGLLHRVEQMPEMALLLLVFHLGVRDGGVAVGAPVHHPVAPIDEPLVVQVAQRPSRPPRLHPSSMVNRSRCQSQLEPSFFSWLHDAGAVLVAARPRPAPGSSSRPRSSLVRPSLLHRRPRSWPRWRWRRGRCRAPTERHSPASA